MKLPIPDCIISNVPDPEIWSLFTYEMCLYSPYYPREVVANSPTFKPYIPSWPSADFKQYPRCFVCDELSYPKYQGDTSCKCTIESALVEVKEYPSSLYGLLNKGVRLLKPVTKGTILGFVLFPYNIAISFYGSSRCESCLAGI